MVTVAEKCLGYFGGREEVRRRFGDVFRREIVRYSDKDPGFLESISGEGLHNADDTHYLESTSREGLEYELLLRITNGDSSVINGDVVWELQSHFGNLCLVQEVLSRPNIPDKDRPKLFRRMRREGFFGFDSTREECLELYVAVEALKGL